MGLRSFFGILSPKFPYAVVDAPPETLAMPERLTLLWPDRAPSDVAPRAGDEVKTGQDLAQNGKGPFISTATGRVEEISAFRGPDGHHYVALAISPSAEDSFEPSLKVIEDFSEAEPVELRAAISYAGLPDLISISRDPSILPPVEALVVSALDLDPLNVANQQAFRDHADQVETGIQLLMRATGASRSVLAVPDNLADVARGVSAGPAEVVMVPAEYPNGLPELLAKNYGAGLLMKGNPMGVIGNTLVMSVEHAIGMVYSLRTGKPLIEKTVTFSIGRNGRLKNFLVRIGTPVAAILKKAGAELRPKGKLILNGAMSGYTCFSDEQPVTAMTDSIHIQAPSEVFFYQKTACTNCGKCNAICPIDLEVNLLGRYSEYGIFDRCEQLGAENCIECGLCAYVCPARRPLVHLISHAKHVIQIQALEDLNMKEAGACDACGPSSPGPGFHENVPE